MGKKRNKKNNHYSFPDLDQTNKGSTYKISDIKTGYDTMNPVFSFRYVEVQKKDSCFSFRDSRIKVCEYSELFNNLSDASKKTWREMKEDRRWHAHGVEWSGTTCKNGFSHLPKGLIDAPVFQFKAVQEKRIFGFFNSKNVFEVVWLDYDHKIYPNDRK